MILFYFFLILNDLAPSCLSDCLSKYILIHSLRSSNAEFLTYCNANLKRSGEVAFSHYAPKFWSLWPIEIRQLPNIQIFIKAFEGIALSYLLSNIFSLCCCFCVFCILLFILLWPNFTLLLSLLIWIVVDFVKFIYFFFLLCLFDMWNTLSSILCMNSAIQVNKCIIRFIYI